MINLSKYKLGDLIEVTRGASLSGEYYAEEGKLVRLTLGNFDMNANGFKLNTSKTDLYFNGEVRDEFILKEGDIITPLTEQSLGLLGTTARIPESGKYIQSQDVALVRCKELFAPDFIYYLLPSKMVRQQLSAGAQQTKIRHTSPDKIKDCVVWVPDYEEQVKIGKFLTAIDRKIALNREINHNLEVMSHQLYDYWFVQFDFPDEEGKPYKNNGGKMVWNEKLKRTIPLNWTNTSLIEIANITMGQSPEGSSYNEKGEGVLFFQGSSDFGWKFPTVRQFTISPTRMAKKGDILMSVRAPVGATNIALQDCCIGRGLCSMNSKMGSLSYLYHVILSLRPRFDQVGGTTFGCITKDELFQLQVLLPDSKTIEAFEKKCRNNLLLQEEIEKEIIALIKQRDELLPLLMNGQVSVNYDLSQFKVFKINK